MLKVWAHTSIAWGIQESLKRSYQIGGNWLQVFAKSPRWWNLGLPKINQETIKAFEENLESYSQDYLMIHSVYLINLAKNPEEATKDVESVIDDFWIADRLWFEAVNVHLGKYWKLSKYQAFDNMCENLKPILEEANKTNVTFLFENTTWQGSEVGYDFAELAEFYQYLKDNIWKDFIEQKINFCFDTAHWWWAWYDINDFQSVLDEFDKHLWLNKLYNFHLNDSKAVLGSKLDRHANLGKWFIWIYALKNVIKKAVENNKPLILETPDDTLWAEEIKLIKDIVNENITENELDDFHQKNFKTEYLKKFADQAKGDTLI